MTRCRDPTPKTRSASTGRSSRRCRRSRAAPTDLRIAVAGGYFRKGGFPEACVAVERVAAALRAKIEIEIPEARARARRRLRHHGERGREPASRPPAHARRRFRSGDARPADRRRDDPGRAGQPRAEIPPLVSRPKCSSCSRRSTRSWRPRRPAPRRRSGRRPSCSTASSCRFGRTSASTPSRSRSSACRSWPCRCRSNPMPIAVQVIAPPWREDIALRIAYALEQAGVCVAPARC